MDETGAATPVEEPFVGSGPAQGSEFWTQPIPAHSLVLELQVDEVPADLPFEIVELAAAEPAPSPALDFAAPPAVFEGDILLGSRPGKSRERQALGMLDERYRWPKGILPYVIDSNLPDAYRIQQAVSNWNSRLAGVVQLVARTNEANYVSFRRALNPGTCQSYIGMQGTGMQATDVGDYCTTGNMIHEIGHSLGLWHEQGRLDRNQFVQIVFANIVSGMNRNFDQNTADGFDLGAYDYGSIMHYPAYAFSANGQATIVTIPAGIPIGQRDALSGGDIAGVRVLYGAPAVPDVKVTLTSNPPGQALIADGQRVVSPFSTTWKAGSEHSVSAATSQGMESRTTFGAWSDGGKQSHIVTASSAAPMITASYSVAHALSVPDPDPLTGSVEITPESPDGFYAAGTEVRLRAVPAAGYCFSGWTGLIPGTPATTALTISKPYSGTAVFAPGSFSLTAYEMDASAARDFSTEIHGPSECAWSASSTTAWIQVRTRSGTGNGVVNFHVDANDTGSTRTGYVVIGGAMLRVRQAGN